MNELSDDEAGFRLWATARRASLRRTAYLMCLDWHLADDLVQDVLTKVYSRWRQVVRTGSPDAYVRRALVTTFIDSRRRPWRREDVVDELPSSGIDLSAEQALEVVERVDRRGRVVEALAALPPGQRAAVVLRFYEDLSVEQTAQVLGCSAGNIKSQTSRGLDQLRRVLGPALGPAQEAPNRTTTDVVTCTATEATNDGSGR